jgi:hypothetical protein
VSNDLNNMYNSFNNNCVDNVSDNCNVSSDGLNNVFDDGDGSLWWQLLDDDLQDTLLDVWFWMELSLDNVLGDNMLDLDDSLLDNLLSLNLFLDQFLDDGSWFLLFNGNLDLNADLLDDDLSMDNSLLQVGMMFLNLDLDVFNKFLLDDLQSLVFNLLLLNQDLNLLFDLLNQNLDLSHLNDKVVNGNFADLSDCQFMDSDSNLSQSDDSDSSNNSNLSDSDDDVSNNVDSDLYNWVMDNNLGDLNGQF